MSDAYNKLTNPNDVLPFREEKRHHSSESEIARDANIPESTPKVKKNPRKLAKIKSRKHVRTERHLQVVLLGSILLLGFVLIDQRKTTTAKTSMLSEQSDDTSSEQIKYYSNPELSIYDKYLCRGFKSAPGCDKNPKHPYIQYMERKFSMNYVEWYKAFKKTPPEAKRVPISQIERGSKIAEFTDK